MPYIEAIIFCKWNEDADGVNRPNAIRDIYAWARANNETLPEVDNKGNSLVGRYSDLTGQANVHQRILDNLGVFVAKLEITTATAAQFASDNRIWTLGYKRFNDEGEQTFSNWNTTLTVDERQKAVQYITNNSNITVAQLANKFDATDTRKVIAQKLKEFFKE